MNEHDAAWEKVIESAVNSEPDPVVPSYVYARMAKHLFPRSLSRVVMWITGILLVISPPLLAYVAKTDYPAGTPFSGLVYTLFGVLSLLCILPVAGSIFHRSGTNLVAFSMQLDEMLRHPLGRHKA